jgi:hypothetical protein
MADCKNTCKCEMFVAASLAADVFEFDMSIIGHSIHFVQLLDTITLQKKRKNAMPVGHSIHFVQL